MVRWLACTSSSYFLKWFGFHKFQHHKALCGLFKTPQSALWPIQCFILGLALKSGWFVDSHIHPPAIFSSDLVFTNFRTTEHFVAYSKHHRALCGLFKTPQSTLWPIQNATKHFVAQSTLWLTQNTPKELVVFAARSVLGLEKSNILWGKG